jgi:putative cell wall-binding protein
VGERSVKSPKGIVCRECRGLNKPGSRFCWFCGAPLPRIGRGPGGGWTVWGLILQGLKWLVAVAAVAAVAVGLYYSVDRVFLPILQKDETPATTVIATTTSTARPTTTTTTTPRDDRIVAGGADRYATAIAISELGFPEGAPALVLVAGDDYAEAISATPLAVAYEGPVLLLPPDGIRDDLGAEIRRLDPSRIFLVGISRPRSVTTQLKDILEKPEVTTLTGDSPYEIAALVAGEVKTKLETVSKVVIVPSDSFIEAIAVAPLAAAKGWPILLVGEGGDVPRATANAIEDLEVDSALVVGTTIELTLDDVETRVGDDGYETAALIVEYALTQGLRFTHTAIATGDAFPDGLVTGSYLALDKGILLLAKSGRLPPVMLTFLTDNLKSIRTLDFIAMPDLAKDLASPNAGTTTTDGGD